MALGLATQGRGKVSPNPLVGAVIVKGGQVVGRGYHKGQGQPHAEIEAIDNAGSSNVQGGALYVNLEPCSHKGRTGPCVKKVVAAGIQRVFIGRQDPNQLVDGKGILALKEAGVDVVTGLLENDATRINEVYFKYITTGIPFVIMKAAVSLDGKIAGKGGASKWISCEKSRALVHRIRAGVDAIMVGAGTIAVDDPQLTVRLPSEPEARSPRPVILDEKLNIKPTASVLKHPARPIIATVKGSSTESHRKALTDKGAEILDVSDKDGLVNLKAVLKSLGKMEISSVLVEGGATLFSSIIREKLVDKAYLFYAATFIGDDGGKSLILGPAVDKMSKAKKCTIEGVTRIGDDVLMEVRF